MAGIGIDDLIGDSFRARHLRDQVAAMVAAGHLDGALCLQAARLCLACGNPARAGWFLAVGLGAGGATEDWCEPVSLALAAAGPATPPEVFRSLDRLAGPAHWRLMQVAVEGLARRHPLPALPAEPADGESLLGLCLARSVLAGDLAAATEVGGRLSLLPRLKRWSHQALGKLAAMQGDLAGAEARFRAGLAADGEALRTWGDLAAVLFCQGREREAREALSRSFVGRPEDSDDPRQQAWRDQLAQAMRDGLRDGGEAGRIGAALNYTHPDRLRRYWDAHREEAGEENGLRTVSAFTNDFMFGRIDALLAAHPEVAKVVNYGTLCGAREAAFARRHPARLIAGYDISEEATALNRQVFTAPNLAFESDLGHLAARLGERPGDSLLAHCRTLDIMFPAAVRDLYAWCRGAGVRFVLSAEYFAARIATFDYPDFAADPVDTVQWEGIVMIHDIPRLLAESGYRVRETSFHPLPLLVSASGEGLQPAQLIQYVLAELIL
ncbi:MAG: hypothetical protein H7841_08890 [Magnetospirillum sp. WYHS-4]